MARVGAKLNELGINVTLEDMFANFVGNSMAVFGYAELSDPQHLADAGAVVFRHTKQLPALLRC